MNWRRERDGLVVVGVAVLVLGLIGTGRGGGVVATFVAAFLGVVAALRFDSLGDDTGADSSNHADAPESARRADTQTEPDGPDDDSASAGR